MNLTKNIKRAEMGTGTLILFISILLVAAIASGVLLQTSSSLQQKSIETGGASEQEISTNIKVLKISATDGRTNLTDFQEILKLSPGSGPIKLSGAIMQFNTIDITGTLKYRGRNSRCAKNNVDGYNTFTTQELGSVNTPIQ